MILMGRNAWREPFVMGLEVSVRTTEDQGSATVRGTLRKKGRRAGMGMWRERFLPGNWMSSGEEVERVLVTMIWQRRVWVEMWRRAAQGAAESGTRHQGGSRSVQRDMKSTWERRGRSWQRLPELRREALLDSQKLRRAFARRM